METESPAVLSDHTSTMMLQNERQVVRKAGRDAIRQFLEQHNCYSVLRVSGKVVVFDTRIPIQLAFYAMVEHGTWVAGRGPLLLFNEDSFDTDNLPLQTCKQPLSGIPTSVNSWVLSLLLTLSMLYGSRMHREVTLWI